MTERASRSEFEWLGMSWPGHREPDPQREEYLTLRARTTCLDFVVAAFAASLTKTLDRAAFVDLMNEGTCGFRASLRRASRRRSPEKNGMSSGFGSAANLRSCAH